MYSILWCSIDSFLAALAIGLVDRQRGRTNRLVAAFAACDGVAYALGHAIRSTPVATFLGGLPPLTLYLYLVLASALLILVLTRAGSSLVWCLPVVLGSDNLISGVLGVPDSPLNLLLASAFVSGCLACAGFYVARSVRPVLSRAVATAAASALVVVVFMAT